MNWTLFILIELIFVEVLILILLVILSKKRKLDKTQKRPISQAEKEILEIVKEFPKEKPIKEASKIKFPKNKYLILSISVFLVFVILFSIILFVEPSEDIKYQHLDVVASNSTGLPMSIYYKQNKIFIINGWESKLIYSEKEDRIAGNNKTGWFFEDPITITDKKTLDNKYSSVVMDSKNDITKAKFDYFLFKRKPYFKIQFSAQTQDNSKLGLMAYGFNLKEYDIYIPHGTKLENDNVVTKTDETTLREGSTHEFDNINYEIFHNPETNLSIVIYGKEIEIFKNSFYWNVYWVYVGGNDGIYEPIYFIILEDSELNYEEGAWQVKLKYYDGELTEI
ncbi:hypothetical protein FP803_04705 [Candidatus Woesearchaeota archaeon]|nr:hypothetical protein [Candidatus Woesearchaeota archaeon]